MNVLQILRIFSAKPFVGNTIAYLKQSLQFRLMWNHDILDLRRIFSLQVRKLWRKSPFAGPNMKAWKIAIFIKKSHLEQEHSQTFFEKDNLIANQIFCQNYRLNMYRFKIHQKENWGKNKQFLLEWQTRLKCRDT